jgi:hypothetical protein
MNTTQPLQSPDILTTARGSEVFLWSEPVKDPTSGSDIPIAFIVVHRLDGLSIFDAAIEFLFQAAYQGPLPWEAFAAALNYLEERPASKDVPGRRGRSLHLGSKISLRKALEREERNEYLNLPDGTSIGSYIRQETDRLSGALDNVDDALAFAEFGYGTTAQSSDVIEGFADSASQLTQGLVTKNISGEEFVRTLLETAKTAGVNLELFLGSRIIHLALAVMFQTTLDEVRDQFQNAWAQIPRQGLALHNLFYRIPKSGTAGALPLWPHLNADGTGIGFRTSGPMKFITEQLKSPSIPELLAIAAFEPGRLPAMFRRIAATASLEAKFTLTDSRARDPLDDRVEIEEGDSDPVEYVEAGGTPHDFLNFFQYECGLTQQEAEVLFDLGRKDVFIDELADRYGVTKGRISHIKKKAGEKVLDAVASDSSAQARLEQLVGRGMLGRSSVTVEGHQDS